MSKPGEFFETETWKQASKDLCIDGWPHVVVLINQESRKMSNEISKLQAALDVAKTALSTIVETGSASDSGYAAHILEKIEEILKDEQSK